MSIPHLRTKKQFSTKQINVSGAVGLTSLRVNNGSNRRFVFIRIWDKAINRSAFDGLAIDPFEPSK